jgi:hypothetical protein
VAHRVTPERPESMPFWHRHGPGDRPHNARETPVKCNESVVAQFDFRIV